MAGALLFAGCSKPDLIVLDTTGNPVQGARVVGASLSVGGQATFTDRWGKAQIPGAVQETKWISIYKHGYIPVENITATQKKPIVIRMNKVPNQ
jgi:hypothetical protein